MNQRHRPNPRNTEAYTQLFERLSIAVEQAFTTEKAAQKKKERDKAELERVKTDYAQLEDSSRTFSLDDLEQSLIEALDKQSNNRSSAPLTLITQEIACFKRDPYKIAAKAFRVAPFSRLSFGASFYLTVVTLATWGLGVSMFTDLCDTRSCTTNPLKILLAVLASALLALFLIGAIAILSLIFGLLDDLFTPPPYQIFRSNSIYLPELRLLFVELKAMQLSPRLSLLVNYASTLKIVLDISPNWHRLKKSMT